MILSLTLIGIASINIYGAAIGTITCFTVAAVLDFRKAYKVIHMPIKLRSLVVKPVIASLLMGLAAWGSYALVASFVSYKIAVVVAILVAVVVYAAAVLILGCLTKYDFELLPGGKKLEKLTRKLGLWNIKRS